MRMYQLQALSRLSVAWNGAQGIDSFNEIECRL
jgi:hypothetical protein